MKKKEYIAPSIEAMEINNLQLLAGSGVASDDIDYGGIDEDGTIEPQGPEFLEF